MSDETNTHWLKTTDIKNIQQNNHWIMQSIEAHEAERSFGPDFTFLCQWMNTAWKTSDKDADEFMQKQVCPLRIKQCTNNPLTMHYQPQTHITDRHN